jgi:hypothetical protein
MVKYFSKKYLEVIRVYAILMLEKQSFLCLDDDYSANPVSNDVQIETDIES